MKVTVITVSFNAESTLADALQSVRDQVLPEGVELEHIAVDGASKDGTVGIIKTFAAMPAKERFSFRWVSEPDKGLYDAMNKGIGMATGDIIGMVNADDMLNATDVIAKVAEAAKDGTDVLGCCIRFVRQGTKYADLADTLSTRFVTPRFWRKWMLSWGWTPPHPGLYIRKSAYEKYGAYLDNYEISSDDEIIVRLVRKCGASYKFVPVCTVAMRLGGKSTQAKNIILQNREFAEMNRANGYFCILPMMFPKFGIKALEIIIPRIMHLFGSRI